MRSSIVGAVLALEMWRAMKSSATARNPFDRLAALARSRSASRSRRCLGALACLGQWQKWEGTDADRIACGLPAPRWRRMVKNVTLPSRLTRAPNLGSI
jgi:hypothetical protein